ncbi:hypothetical protein BDM02DRAFT_2449377 [Thelephora ganbajun]|uniref:Uncharacterized protein n=1 Tax=Thelephora ganbajun TaxID=370292 RepID=A0ACB6ZDW2_THEGA|nr:hypothetical protein BDM02DRAFT_2449377 [Thelephora ganbajun]
MREHRPDVSVVANLHPWSKLEVAGRKRCGINAVRKNPNSSRNANERPFCHDMHRPRLFRHPSRPLHNSQLTASGLRCARERRVWKDPDQLLVGRDRWSPVTSHISHHIATSGHFNLLPRTSRLTGPREGRLALLPGPGSTHRNGELARILGRAWFNVARPTSAPEMSDDRRKGCKPRGIISPRGNFGSEGYIHV